MRALLGIEHDRSRLRLVYSPVRGASDELAVQTRSMLQIMSTFASYVQVPEPHLRDRRASPGVTPYPAEGAPPVVIHSSKEQPPDAFVAVRYREYWFWVDDRDWQTKRAMVAIMFFFSLTDTGTGEKLPLITIPAG
jgi:hypothetical protein